MLKTGKEIDMFPVYVSPSLFHRMANSLQVAAENIHFMRTSKLWEIATGQKVELIDDLPPSASVLQFSEDGKTLVTLG